MNIIFTSVPNSTIVLPINLLFWLGVSVLAVHILEESAIPEVFVEKVKRLYWPGYNWRKFFGFNSIFLILNITSVILFETFQNGWIILPLAFFFERVFNGIYHLLETVVTKKYSAGLLTSVIVWIILYLIIRYSLIKGEISYLNFFVSMAIGLCINLLMIVPMALGLYRKLK